MQFGHGTQSDDVTNRPKALVRRRPLYAQSLVYKFIAHYHFIRTHRPGRRCPAVPSPLPLALHPFCLPPSPPPPGPRGSPQSTGAPLWETDCRLPCSLAPVPLFRRADKDRLSREESEFSIELARSSGRIAAARLRDERSDLTMSLRDNRDVLRYQPCKFRRQRLI